MRQIILSFGEQEYFNPVRLASSSPLETLPHDKDGCSSPLFFPYNPRDGKEQEKNRGICQVKYVSLKFSPFNLATFSHFINFGHLLLQAHPRIY